MGTNLFHLRLKTVIFGDPIRKSSFADVTTHHSQIFWLEILLLSIKCVSSFNVDVLKEMVLNFQSESLNTIIPILLHYHTAVQESSIPSMKNIFKNRIQIPVTFCSLTFCHSSLIH